MPELTSQIVAVTVFSDRARVTRRTKTTLEGGAHRLEFTELPVTVDRDSIRVAARGTAGLKLLGVDVRTQHFRETPLAKLRELEARLQSLQDEEAADADRDDLLAKHMAHLDGLSEATRIYAHGLASGKTSVEQQHQLVCYLDQGRETIQTRARALGLQRRERKKEIDQLQIEYTKAKVAKPKERVAVAVEAKASARGEFEMEVTYVIPGASWEPLYDIRLLIDQIELAYLGQVQQQTGEDWNGVRLTLSTARPAVRAEIPQLEPWHLRPQMAARMVAMAAPGTTRSRMADPAPPAMAASASMEDMLGAAEAAMLDAAPETAEVEQTGGSVSYVIPGQVDIPSDGSPHKTTVGFFRLPPKFDGVTVPKREPIVYRRAKVTNTSPFVLLDGEAQLFLGDDFIGKTQLKRVAAGQAFDVCFGPDDQLRVERSLTKRDVSKTFMGGKRRIQFAYEIRLWNHADQARPITVVDQAPHSLFEDIRVTVESTEPKPERQSDLNILIWKLTLPAGGEQKIRLAFTVDHPKEMPIAGL